MMNSIAQDLDAISKIEAIPRILDVVCRTTGLGFAAVARVTDERWVACAVRDEIDFGLLAGGELRVATTICNEIRNSGQAVVIDHVADDEAYCNHPTPKMYGFQSYISVPIYRAGGQFFGTLCAIDPRPASLNRPETINMFKLFADLIAFHLDAQERLKLTEAALLDERETAKLREQFIAILGHDLRNPLNAIAGAATILQKMPLIEDARPVVAMVQRSSVRMEGLIENVLDFARGRLGGGLTLIRTADVSLASLLEQVIAEARIAWPQREILSEVNLERLVDCDGARIAQMFSNLLENALSHGHPDRPVGVRARSGYSGFELSVTNHGEPIPPEVIGRLFQPFFRASSNRGQGLGLGLHIASEIARAHQGSLEVESSAQQTRFTFRMPASASEESLVTGKAAS